jgi:thiol-disulfide isomerase/thioredoxin
MRLRTNGCRLAAAAVTIAAALVVPSAFAFEITDTNGKRHNLADYKGRWVVVNFWATWCAPCIKEIPEIAEFREANAARAVVLGIALDVEGEAKTIEFAKKVGHAYPLVLGDDKSEKQFGKVKGLPTTLVFDPSGKRVYDRLGTVTRKSLEQIVDRQDIRRGAP